MANSKGQNDVNQDSDDFLSEFLSFVHQHKESAPVETNGVSIIYKTQSNTSTATIENSVFDLEIPCIEDTIAEEDESILDPKVHKPSCLPDVTSNDAVIGILSDPVISTVDELTPFLQTKYADTNTDLSFSKDSRVEDVISKTVSAELEKVLGDHHVFEEIGLYLECSEDEIQSIQKDNADKNKFGTGNFCLHAGNLSVQSDSNFLKISFPTSSAENDDWKRCSSCKLVFTSAVELFKHLNSGDCKVLFCKECVYNTKSVKRFLTHMEKRHGASRITVLRHDHDSQSCCNNSNLINELETSCTEETNTETDDSPVKCDRSADELDSFEDNNKAGEIASKFQCQLCEYAGSSAKLLKMHHQNAHNRNRGLYCCKNCSFTCLQKRTVDAHSKTHEKEFLFNCSECKKSFATSSALTRHSKTHRISRDFVCSVCGKAFKIKGSLTDHMKKVHMVDAANLFHGFNSNDQCSPNKKKLKLNDAISVAENVDAVSATDCDNKAISCVGKEKQRNFIVQNKRFLCSWPNCGKRFRDNYNLNSHFLRHTENKDLCCSECDFKCIQKGHLNYHIKTKHLEK